MAQIWLHIVALELYFTKVRKLLAAIHKIDMLIKWVARRCGTSIAEKGKQLVLLQPHSHKGQKLFFKLVIIHLVKSNVAEEFNKGHYKTFNTKSSTKFISQLFQAMTISIRRLMNFLDESIKVLLDSGVLDIRIKLWSLYTKRWLNCKVGTITVNQNWMADW
mgnify:CR=1 FL=1